MEVGHAQILGVPEQHDLLWGTVPFKMAEAPTPGDESSDEDSQWKKDMEDSDVTIFFKPEDAYRIEKTILSNFEQLKLKFIRPAISTPMAAHQYKNIAKAIKNSKKTLLILSESAKNIDFSLETYLALEQCLQTGRLSLMVLLIDGMSVQELPEIPFLQQATQMVLVDNYHERCMETVCKTLKREVSLNQLLPAGNFAVGMAWSHFAGYLKNILPVLAQYIQKSDIFQNNLGKMSTVFFMLCPLSAKGQRDIADIDPNVQNMGRVVIEMNGRKYTPTIYKVNGKNENGKDEEYFCCAEYPSALCALGLITDEVLNLLTPLQRRTEVERFKYKTEELLNHTRNQECFGRAKVLVFDDEGKDEESTPSRVLFKGVRSAIEETFLKPVGEKPPGLYDPNRPAYSKDVCFLYSDSDAHESKSMSHSKNPDNKTINSIRGFLEDKNIRCSIARPPIDSPDVVEERVKEARWVCCLISNNTIKKKRFIEFWLAALLNKCIEKNHLKIVILLKDVDSSYIPNFIQWVTYIDIVNEPSFEERIFEIIKGDVISLKSQVPVGNVAFGLAWAFHVNYLRHVLPDFNERLQHRMAQDDIRKLTASREFKVSKHLLELVPESCNFKPLLHEIDERIQPPLEIKPIEKQMNATKKVFSCKLYRIQGETCDYYFAGEMLTPINALSQMNVSMIAGLSKQRMYEQRDQLVDQITAILQSKATPAEMQDKCRCIKYNDQSWKLADVIMKEIDKDSNEDHETKYGNWLKRQNEEES